MQYNLEECGMRIAKLRNQNGYTQERLANVLNMDRSILSRAEAGKRGLSIEIYVQLSALFDVSLDYLLVGKGVGEIAQTLNDEHIETPGAYFMRTNPKSKKFRKNTSSENCWSSFNVIFMMM